MSGTGSVTQLLKQVRGGDQVALAKLLDRYWPFLLARAGQRLKGKGAPCRFADEEDVVQDVLLDFSKGFEDGRWQELVNRHDLASLLALITKRKADNLIKHERTLSRGAGRVQGESGLNQVTESGPAHRGLELQAEDSALSPQEEVLQEEWNQFCLASLPVHLRPIAELHLAGATVREIASTKKCCERTVARKIALIRAKWLEMVVQSGTHLEPPPSPSS